MIKLMFMLQTGIAPELMRFQIDGKKVTYFDKIWQGGIVCLPPEKDFEKKIILSRNKYPKKLVDMFKLTEKDIEEYEKAQGEKELAEIIIRDCESKGLRLIGGKDGTG